MESNVKSFDRGYVMGRDHMIELVNLVLNSGVSNRIKVKQMTEILEEEADWRKSAGF